MYPGAFFEKQKNEKRKMQERSIAVLVCSILTVILLTYKQVAQLGSTEFVGNFTATELQKWDNRSVIMFVHIGKSGGTSFDSAIKEWLKINQLPRGLYFGNRHFDWSMVEEYTEGTIPITILRHPVDRAISHFNFMKTLKWTRNDQKFQSLSLSEFLSMPKLMRKYRGCWQDGQASVAWLSGRQNQSWIEHRDLGHSC